MNDELVKLISFHTLNVITYQKALKNSWKCIWIFAPKIDGEVKHNFLMQLAISKPREMSSKLVKDFGVCPRSRPFILNRTSVF